MDRNPAVSQINDLILMMLAGMAMYLWQTHMTEFDFLMQLLSLGGFTFVAGMFMERGSQLAEWFIFFLLGGIIATSLDTLYPLIGDLRLVQPTILIEPIIKTCSWYFYLLISFLVGLPAGSLINRLMVGDYWLRRNIYLE